MKNHTVLACAASIFAGVSAFAGGPNAAYAPSSVDARLNVTVKEGTDVVHFVRDDATPNVITKAYEIKHVDPYELRNYLRGIVQTRRVNDKLTNVEAVKYSDGSALVLISAEDYRFDDTPTAQGFDSIVKELDKPKLVASSGRKTYVYSPKYRSSAEIMAMVNAIGTFGKDVVMGNLGGTDVTVNDPGLNLIFFNTAPFSRKTIMDVLAEYDKPYPEVRAKVTVYELSAENDTKLGLDFQAWKNNDGIDLFNAGGRFSRNYSNQTISLASGAKWNDATYFNFNPKWNTKYLDFLTSKGKAKVVLTSELNLRNQEVGILEKTTQVFVAHPSEINTENDKIYNQNPDLAETYGISPDRIKAYAYNYAVIPAPPEVLGKDFHGQDVVLVYTAPANIMIMRIGEGLNSKYIAYAAKNSTDHFANAAGANLGKKVELKSLYVDFTANANRLFLGTKRGKQVNVIPGMVDFGFKLSLKPSINTKATKLEVAIKNSSLVGYTSDGMPRVQEDSELTNEFMISNEGTKLVIGGLEKRSVMRVSGGVPILKDLPIIGWLFSTETEATKRSQLVVVAEVLPVQQADNYKELLDKARKDLSKAGESNKFGYRQYLIDADRK